MSCNTCSRSFSFLRPEKGCPACGFSYCSKCLNNKVFVKKLNAEVKVCVKCKQTNDNNEPRKVEPPDAYYKRLGAMSENSTKTEIVKENTTEQEIQDRLKRLKEDKTVSVQSDKDIASRLQKLKGDIPSTSTAELESRLANIRGVPISAVQTQPKLPGPDLRTEQEQADDLLRQYMAQTSIDTKYKDEFDNLVEDIETRLKNLKGSTDPAQKKTDNDQSETEDEIIRKIMEKAKAEATLEDNEFCDSTSNELPFCEICNEDAKMRCLGCKYLFCKRCFIEHKDDDDGCDKYEVYNPPKS